MPFDAVDDLYKDFLRVAEESEMPSRKGFARLLQAIWPKRSLADTDVDEWWGRITKPPHECSDRPEAEAIGEPNVVSKATLRVQCSFTQFVDWFAAFEAAPVPNG